MKGPFSLLLCTKGSIPKPTANDRNNSMKCLVKFVESLGLYLSTDILSSNLFRKVSKEDVSCDRLPTRRAFQLLANKGSKFNVRTAGIRGSQTSGIQLLANKPGSKFNLWTAGIRGSQTSGIRDRTHGKRIAMNEMMRLI